MKDAAVQQENLPYVYFCLRLMDFVLPLSGLRKIDVVCNTITDLAEIGKIGPKKDENPEVSFPCTTVALA